ncbi:MAG: mechanosensitive ion channel family protein [Sulfurovum sp.]
MPITPTNDINITNSLDIIDDLSMNLDERIQVLLSPLYHEFPILANTFFGIPLANLFGAILVFLVFLLFRHFFTLIIMGTLLNLSKLTKTYYDERVISALKAPVRFTFIIIGAHVFFLLTFQETETIKHILNTLIIFTIFWSILAIMNALRGLFHSATAKFNPDLAKEMGDFILTISKVVVVGVGLGAMLQVWGINVTALVASLGLGGLAFALAAKDTAANLFGSFALLADKSIRIGEWIKVGGVEGVVEDIGMRTTKIRSFQKSLITVPNQIVSNSHIENFSRRGIRRIKLSIGLTYSTTGEQVNTIVQEIKYMLKNHKDISTKDTLLVNFDKFGDSSLDIFIYAFSNTANWSRYMDIKEDVYLQVMKIVEDNNSSFAFPSQSIYMKS